tara:strand:+ start:1062 stop:1946 length:885 start_codon:yes stop_codon:yes gene_type:complete
MAEFCLGTAQLGMQYGIANFSSIPDQIQINKIISKSLSNGIRYFDTAQSYGESESVLGIAFSKSNFSPNVRVISKYFPNSNVFAIDDMKSSVMRSLEKLRLNQMYGLLAHRFDLINNEVFIKGVEDLKNNGYINKFGVSVYEPDEAITAIKSKKVDIIQIPFNIIDKRWIDKGIIKSAKKNNIRLFFRSIFLQGIFFLNDFDLNKKNMAWAIPYMSKFRILVQNTNLDIIQLSFKILSDAASENVIIFGVDNINQLISNIERLKLINEINLDFNSWWDNIPNFPEKLLNPSLWN